MSKTNKPRTGVVRASDIAAHPTKRIDAEYWLDQAVNEPTPIGQIDCPAVQLPGNFDDTIKRGDRVSWRYDGHDRQYGRVVRMAVQDFQRAYSVRDDEGNGLIIPARLITKECG